MSDEFIQPSELASSVKPGVYRHFKGGEYKLVCVGRDSEDNSRELVVYQSLKTGSIWIRPLEMFVEEVDRPEYKGKRFIWIRVS